MKTEIHIWDLPTNKIYIKFNEEFREKLFGLAHKKFGNFNLVGEFLNVKRPDTTIASNWRDGMNCCPLNLMIKLANRIEVPLTQLEKNVEEIRYKTKLNNRGGSSGKSIRNPKLPILIDEDFAEILGHICGDGSIVTSHMKKGIGFRYVNSEPHLIKSFQELMKTVFGDVEAGVIVRNGPGYRRDNYVLQYPSIISIIVLSVFDYKVDEDMDVPPFIFDMPKKAKARFLRAIFDDEGCVVKNDKKIQFGLKPIKPLLNIKKLLSELGIKTGGIYKGTTHRFEIAEQNSILLFRNIIGFKHPEKIKKLDNMIVKGWKFKRYYNGEAKEKIIELLRNKSSLCVKEISYILKRKDVTVREHLNNLREKGKAFNRRIQQRVNSTNSFPNIWFVRGKENVSQK